LRLSCPSQKVMPIIQISSFLQFPPKARALSLKARPPPKLLLQPRLPPLKTPPPKLSLLNPVKSPGLTADYHSFTSTCTPPSSCTCLPPSLIRHHPYAPFSRPCGSISRVSPPHQGGMRVPHSPLAVDLSPVNLVPYNVSWGCSDLTSASFLLFFVVLTLS